MTKRSKRWIAGSAICLLAMLGFGTSEPGRLLGRWMQSFISAGPSGTTVGEVEARQSLPGDSAGMHGIQAAQPRSNMPGPAGRHPFVIGDVRELMLSGDVAKLDYGLLRALNECGTVIGPHGEQVVRDMYANGQQGSPIHRLLTNRTALEPRLAAFSRARARCQELYPEGWPKDAFLAEVRKTPTFATWHANHRLLREHPDLDTLAGREALRLAVERPTLATLQYLLMHRLDLSPLQGSYPEDLMQDYGLLASDLLLCRMGDDCGTGGLVTERACWAYGLCGISPEAAVMESLAALGHDPGPLHRFISSTYGALQRGDSSIFRKLPPPGR